MDYFFSSPTVCIPRSSLGYGTNNKYKDFPPLMSDGRSIVSNTQNIAVLNKKLITDNGITSNWKYRQYMIKNANTIMEYNYRESSNDTGYMIPINNSKKDKLIIPYTFDSLNDSSKPHQMTDLKELYLSREQLNAKKVVPVLFKN
jgi:hypothetical protein